MTQYGALVACFLLSTFLAGYVHAEQFFKSSAAQTQLIELYTSEGCSSCPPADQWLSRYTKNPALWQSVIPVAFHVDYWDDLGWPDRFAAPQYTARQRQHKREKNTRAVYTPGFIVNGKEWKGWWAHRSPPVNRAMPGTLSMRIDDDQSFEVNFLPNNSYAGVTKLTVAVVAFGLKTPVKAGENKGELLTHDFVVVGFGDYRGAAYEWKGALPFVDPRYLSKSLGVVAWISDENSLRPIQVVGGALTL